MKKGYTGFSFRGIHTDDFDGVAAVSTDDRPIVPDVKETTFSPLNRDGVYDFSAANPAGREYYEERIFQLKIKVKAADFTAMQKTLTLLSRWLKGGGDLIFDDTPFVKWAARIVEAVPYAPEREGRKAELDVKYRVQPFCETIFNVFDGPILDSDIPLDSAVPIGMDEYFTFTGAGTYTVKNIGEVPVRPVITVAGATGQVSISVNSTTITVPGNAVIDCDRHVVTDANGNSIMTRVTGEFFELREGANTLKIAASGNVTVTVKYSPKYMYDVDLDEMGFE